MAPTACTHPVSGTFHSPSGVLFAFPSRYWFTIGQLRVFSLGGWSPLVPKDSSDRVSRAPPYSISRHGRFRVRGYHPLWRAFPGASANAAATEAAAFPPRLRAVPLSLIATEGISVDFFSSGYLDISVPRVRFALLCVQSAIAIEMAGFPHSEIPGSKSVCRLPEAYRRLRRPSSPSAAKASTECACSLDHMTEATQAGTQGAARAALAVWPEHRRITRARRRPASLRTQRDGHNSPSRRRTFKLVLSVQVEFNAGNAQRRRTRRVSRQWTLGFIENELLKGLAPGRGPGDRATGQWPCARQANTQGRRGDGLESWLRRCVWWSRGDSNS